MTLQERGRRLEQRIVRAAEIKTQTEEANRIGDRKRQADAFVVNLRDAFERCMVLREAGADIEVPDTGETLRACSMCISGVTEGNLSDLAWVTLKAAVDVQATQLRQVAGQAGAGIQEQVRRQNVAALEGIAAAFGKMELFRRLLAEQNALMGANWGAMPLDQMRSALRRRDQLVEHAAQLADTDAPPSVQKFLTATRRGDGRLEDLTDEVREWMTANRLLDRLRISLGSGNS